MVKNWYMCTYEPLHTSRKSSEMYTGIKQAKKDAADWLRRTSPMKANPIVLQDIVCSTMSYPEDIEHKKKTIMKWMERGKKTAEKLYKSYECDLTTRHMGQYRNVGKAKDEAKKHFKSKMADQDTFLKHSIVECREVYKEKPRY